MKKIRITVFSFLCCLQYAAAQDTLNSISATPIQGGKIFSSFERQLTGTFHGFAVGYQRSMTRDSSRWARALRVQDICLEGNYLDFHSVSLAHTPGSKGLLGSAYGLSVRLDALLFSIGAAKIMFSPGLGLEYVTQTYYTNDNKIMGSNLNLYLQAGIRARAPISGSLQIEAGIGGGHISDAGTVKPNCGLNFAAGSLGFVYAIGSTGPAHKRAAFETNTKSSFELDVTAGSVGRTKTGYFWDKETGKGVYDTTGRQNLHSDFYQWHISLAYNHPIIRQVLSVRLGTDLTYFSKLFAYQDFLGTYQGTSSSYSHTSVGISAGADVWLGRMDVSIAQGYFVRQEFLTPQKTYWTGSVKYYLASWFALNATATMHGGEPAAGFGIALLAK